MSSMDVFMLRASTCKKFTLNAAIVFIDKRGRGKSFSLHLNPNISTSGPELCGVIQSHRLTTVPHTLCAGYQGDREVRPVK